MVNVRDTYNETSASFTVLTEGNINYFSFANDGSNEITVDVTLNTDEALEFKFKAGEQWNFSDKIQVTKPVKSITVSQSSASDFRLYLGEVD